jgi:hypothetical protein
MTYRQAKELREKNLKLIGTIDSQGFTIGELLIVPSNPQSQISFLQKYLITQNADNAISAYIGEDLLVWAVDIQHLLDDNVLFYNDISNE